MMVSTSPNAPIVVIGAGLAGLAAAAYLARAGRLVVLVEAGAGHGGCCSTTRVDGFAFNNGAVYVAVPSLLRTAFAHMGADLDREVPMAAILLPFESHLEDGSVVRLGDAASSHVEGPDAAQRTQILRDGLGQLQQEWAPVYRALVQRVLPHGPSPWNALLRLGPHLAKMRGTVAALIRRRFPDAGVQAAIGSLLLYAGLPPERLAATQIIGLLALLEEGFHLPHGGMGAIGDALLRHAQASGAIVHLGQRAQRIELENGRPSGVLLASGERIAASSIVTTISGFELVHRLLPPGAVPSRLARVAKNAPLSHRAISIQLGCDAPAGEGAFIVSHVPDLARQGLMHETPEVRPEWLSYTVPTRVLSGLAPAGKSIVECFAPATGIARASEWSPRRTEAVVQRYIEGLRQRLPGLSVETLRVTDPAAFERQRHLYEGALYGIAPGTPPHHLFPHRSGIAGLYLAGQTTFPGYGVATAVWSGLQAAEALLQDECGRGRR